jgi:hypothetical protein
VPRPFVPEVIEAIEKQDARARGSGSDLRASDVAA